MKHEVHWANPFPHAWSGNFSSGVPQYNYAGQVSVNGQPFEGEGLFKFALVNTDGKITYWSNDGTSVTAQSLRHR